MPFTSADLIEIDQAIASGAREVRFKDGRSVTYRDVDDLLLARRRIEAAIASAAGSKRKRTFRVYQKGTGL